MNKDNEMSENLNIPFQVQQIINSLLDPKDNVYVRANYRMRLDTIRAEINKAIVKYDQETFLANSTVKGKKRRA
jgi:hypothetical protein